MNIIPWKYEVKWLEHTGSELSCTQCIQIHPNTIFTGFSSAPSQPPALWSQRRCAQLQWCSCPWKPQLIGNWKDTFCSWIWGPMWYMAVGNDMLLMEVPKSALAPSRQPTQMWMLPSNETGMQLVYWLGPELHFLQLIRASESKVQAA